MSIRFVVTMTQALVVRLVSGQMELEDLSDCVFAISGTRNDHLAAIESWVVERLPEDPARAKAIGTALRAAYEVAEADGRLCWRNPQDKLIAVIDRVGTPRGLHSVAETYREALADQAGGMGPQTFRGKYGPTFNPRTGQNARSIQTAIQVKDPGVLLVS